MKFLRYKTLSQFIDTENLYSNLEFLSEVYMLGDNYFVFLKRKNSNEMWMTKESFAGGFEVFRIPLNTQGITISQWDLIKFYAFNKIGVNFMMFKINPVQFLTIMENDSGQSAVFIDTTDDAKTVALANTACPILTTKSGENWTMHSFNDKQDGSASSIIYNNNITWDDWTSAINPSKLNDSISTNTFSSLSFSALISDTAGSDMLFSYAMTDGTAEVYCSSLSSLQSNLFNQVISDQTVERSFSLNELSTYINFGISENQALVVCTNNTLIYYDLTDNTYSYKNILAYFYDSSFDTVTAFDVSGLRYNLFKQILYTFEDVTDVNTIKISKLALNSNMFMVAESNLGLLSTNSVVYKENGVWLYDAPSVLEIVASSRINVPADLISHNFY